MIAKPPRPDVRRIAGGGRGGRCSSEPVSHRSRRPMSLWNLPSGTFGWGTGKFVNALLRRVRGRNPEFQRSPCRIAADVWSAWRKRFNPARLQQLADVFLSSAPFTFRAIGRFEPASEFACRPVECFAPFPLFHCGKNRARFLESNALRDGKIYIQDPATTLAVSLPDFTKVTRALDVCAAPGGKSLMIAERLKIGRNADCRGSFRTAAEADPGKISSVTESISRS